MTVLHVVGARPNFMKAAPVYRALAKVGFNQVLVHTGQHYDALMSDVFFQQLGMSAPDKRSFMKELEKSAEDKNL